MQKALTSFFFYQTSRTLKRSNMITTKIFTIFSKNILTKKKMRCIIVTAKKKRADSIEIGTPMAFDHT